MATALAILAFLGALAKIFGPSIANALKNRAEKAADPNEQNLRRKEDADAAIAAGQKGLADINAQLDDYSRRLPPPADPGNPIG